MATVVPGIKFSLIPRKNRKKIYEYLFKEGVLVVKKDPNLVRHPEIDVPNLHVLMSMKSLKSRELVQEQFNWQHHYYFLKNEGIEHLREYLHLPQGVFPSTLTRQARPQRKDDFERSDGQWRGGEGGGGRGFGRGRGGGGDRWGGRSREGGFGGGGGFGRGGGGGFGRGGGGGFGEE